MSPITRELKISQRLFLPPSEDYPSSTFFSGSSQTLTSLVTNGSILYETTRQRRPYEEQAPDILELMLPHTRPDNTVIKTERENVFKFKSSRIFRERSQDPTVVFILFTINHNRRTPFVFKSQFFAKQSIIFFSSLGWREFLFFFVSYNVLYTFPVYNWPIIKAVNTLTVGVRIFLHTM